MNSEQIEKILRNPPAIKTPEGLQQKLNADIRLQQAQTERADWAAPQPWLRRWMPALSFATIFLVCVAAIAMQTNELSQLKTENGRLRAEQGDLDVLRASNAEFQKLRVENQELERLRKDNLELLQLRDEVAKLNDQTKELAGLRAENARLRAAMSANANANQSGDFFADAKARAERIQCVNHLKQIGLAARIWANDNNDVYPPNFICMSNELGGSFVLLQCPSDKSHNVTSWEDVAAGNISYIMDAPGLTNFNPQVIFVECPIHHNICLMDGSVQQMSEKAMQEHVKVVDGLKTWINP